MREIVSTVVLIDLTDTSSVSHWRKLVASALHFVFLLSDCVKAPNIPLHYCHMPSLTLNLVAPCVSFISQVIYQLPQLPHFLFQDHVPSCPCACALFHFRGYGSVPVALSPKRLVNQTNFKDAGAGMAVGQFTTI